MATGTLNMGDLSAGETAGILGGIVSVLTVLGAGIRWLFGRNDDRLNRREKNLNDWEKTLQRREREMLSYLEGRLKELETAQVDQAEKISAVSAALFETMGELQRLDPGSSALARARLVLKDAYPIDPSSPPEIKALVRKLDTAKG